MCWNAEVSRNTFLIGAIGILFGLYYGMSLPAAFFCFSITLMQLIEYFVWTYYDNKTVNYWASVTASSLLWIQPIASIATVGNVGLRNTMFLSYGLLSLVGQYIEDGKRDYSMTRAPNGHLSWNWMSSTTDKNNWKLYASLAVYMMFLFVPIFINKQYDLIVLAIGTLSLSLFSYWRNNTWGSMWCWIVNAIVLLIVGKQMIRINGVIL